MRYPTVEALVALWSPLEPKKFFYPMSCHVFPQTSSSSVGPVANATDVLQPSRLIVLTISPPPPVWMFPRSPPGTPHVHNDARGPSSKRWNCMGENWLVILPEIVTSTSIQRSFTCHKSATWDPWLYFPSEGRRAEEFFALKNPDGFGRVWTRELGYLKAALYPKTTEAPLPIRLAKIFTGSFWSVD